MTTLTAILLTYNHEDTVAESLKSIISQETTFPFHILILDDCSQDGTSKLCMDYASSHPGLITHIRQSSNLGAVQNFRFGLNMISSPYISFLEGDDRWIGVDKLQLMVDALEENPECLMGGHDTLKKNWKTGKESLYVGDRSNGENIQIFTGPPGPFGMHPSSRVYRNHDCLRNLPENLLLDSHIYRHYLYLGKALYINRVMSVFNYTGKGMWSGRKKISRKIMTINLAYEASTYYNHEKDADILKEGFFLAMLKNILGKKDGWIFYRRLYLSWLYFRRILSG